ncbi:MAG TPA: glycosyltransferase family A protein [Solirubrobacterales bacterium]|jgi:glycosyltransferase involved in cell wall biosynthesis|nr:glycosyltransferase family A protein [Solirubrobacterales bacterium]
MTSNPLVSVVIPAYNAERYIAESIASVLAQTYAPLELIVVDDGSTDRTAELAGGYAEATVIVQQNSGPSAARNRGAAVASGEFLAFHDSDDTMTPDKLAVQVARMLDDPGTGCVLAEQELLVEPGAELPFWVEGSKVPTAMPPRPPELADEPMVHPMTMVVRREVFARVGPFDESMRAAEDFDWMLRATEAEVEIARLSDVLLRRRVHAGSLTQDAEASRAGLFRAFKGRIERHRARAAG